MKIVTLLLLKSLCSSPFRLVVDPSQVVAGELPMNHEITYQLQDIFNLLPDVTNPVFVRSLQVHISHKMTSPHYFEYFVSGEHQ